ncbi:hypothetical protein H8L32_25990 [Undibacterium sp. CY18W]|uniref:Uncharacterized protein n=1 Tax=Undibacterium hunanense TaxID=2762292 RepID=A0ABR6ZYI4_9BURK|nr:hypothetical protein [Undibacterium hunanense]MBC3920943.1 hypothetical protein [Undibacterium hunanense]
MTASQFYLSKPVWQKPAYLLGIVILHVLLLLFVRQALQKNTGQSEAYRYLDVSFIAPALKVLPQVPQIPAAATPSQPITQLPQRLRSQSRDSQSQVSNTAPSAINQGSEHEASGAPISAAHDAISLDLDSLRKAALAEDKKHMRSQANRIPMAATADLKFEEKFGRDVQEAKRKDCLNAYSNGARVGNVALAGLLVAGVIVADTVTGKGCKW